MAKSYITILFYKYVYIQNVNELVTAQILLCKKLGIKGRTLIANEGINGTLEGAADAIEQYCSIMISNPLFSDIAFKKSVSDGNAFSKLFVRARSEIVTSGLGGLKSPNERVTGIYLKPEEFHAWIHSKKEFYIVDMRNDYEQSVGIFENSLLPGMGHFRDLPTVLPRLEHLKNKTMVTVCTGGVRCEKASGFLVENGFADVYQLEGGIVTYMEKYPNQDFKGKLYVFDTRITIGFNVEDPTHVIVGTCEKCKLPSERFVNCSFDDCHRHFICCEKCNNEQNVFCNSVCESQYQLMRAL